MSRPAGSAARSSAASTTTAARSRSRRAETAGACKTTPCIKKSLNSFNGVTLPARGCFLRSEEAFRMRQTWIAPRIVYALALLLAGCTSAQKAAAPAASIVGPVWVAEDIAGTAAGGEAPITLQLGADGRASGRGG